MNTITWGLFLKKNTDHLVLYAFHKYLNTPFYMVGYQTLQFLISLFLLLLNGIEMLTLINSNTCDLDDTRFWNNQGMLMCDHRNNCLTDNLAAL